MIRRSTLAWALPAIVTAASLLPSPAGAAEPIWRLEQPDPPPGVPFKVPLGAPGDLAFWAPNRGLLTVEGNDTIPRGIYSWNGRSWHQLATVCGGPGDTARIAWAGPTEFWVVSEPSLPRRGSGLALCRFKDGQVVGSWSTRVDAADPFRQMTSAACNGPSDCWFGGVGSQDPLGERIGAFHLHWNGSDLLSLYGPQGRGVTDLQFHAGALYESTLVGRSPENRTDPVDLAEPEPVPRLIHRLSGVSFVNDPFEPAPLPEVPADGSELLGLDSDGTDLWAVGGGAASGPSAPAGGGRRAAAAGRSPPGRRLPRAEPQRRRLRRQRPARRRRRDSRRRSARHGRPLRRSPQRQQQGDRGADRAGRRDEHRSPADGGCGARQRRPGRLSGAGRMLAGHLGRLALPLQRRDAAAARHRAGVRGHDRVPPQRVGGAVHPRPPAG